MRSDRLFLIVFLAVIGIIIVCGISMTAIAIYGPVPQPPAVADLFATLKVLFTAGVGSVLTLLPQRVPNRRPQRAVRPGRRQRGEQQ